LTVETDNKKDHSVVKLEGSCCGSKIMYIHGPSRAPVVDDKFKYKEGHFFFFFFFC
jgi:hypothetical protein